MINGITSLMLALALSPNPLSVVAVPAAVDAVSSASAVSTVATASPKAKPSAKKVNPAVGVRKKPGVKKTPAVKTGPTQSCSASFYSDPQPTASGERFNPNAMTAAHKTLPMGTRVKVTNPSNGKSVVVRINDRGPYIAGRCLDLSRASFAKIANLNQGHTKVNWAIVK